MDSACKWKLVCLLNSVTKFSTGLQNSFWKVKKKYSRLTLKSAATVSLKLISNTARPLSNRPGNKQKDQLLLLKKLKKKSLKQSLKARLEIFNYSHSTKHLHPFTAQKQLPYLAWQPPKLSWNLFYCIMTGSTLTSK